MTWGTDEELPPLNEEEIANFSAIRKSTMKENRGSSAIGVFREKIGDFNADRYFKYRASVNMAKIVKEKAEQSIDHIPWVKEMHGLHIHRDITEDCNNWPLYDPSPTELAEDEWDFKS